ncbi:hypothetical protein C8J57DRAFT_352446 [Mycena rebaudengoi]|nr:hypothetical protein C8J57DRAFT_352446 [Mycena rebaudengoi]
MRRHFVQGISDTYVCLVLLSFPPHIPSFSIAPIPHPQPSHSLPPHNCAPRPEQSFSPPHLLPRIVSFLCQPYALSLHPRHIRTPNPRPTGDPTSPLRRPPPTRLPSYALRSTPTTRRPHSSPPPSPRYSSPSLAIHAPRPGVSSPPARHPSLFFPIHTRRPLRSIPFLGTPSPSSFHSPHAHRPPPPPISIVLRIPNMFPNRSPPTARPPSQARPSDDHIHPRTHPYPDPNPHPTNLLPQHTLLPQHSLRPPKPSTPAGWSYSSVSSP